MSFFTESDLPGIGKKINLTTHSREKAVVIIHHDGNREFYIMDQKGEQLAGITLLDEEARRVGSILSGMVFKPKSIEELEGALSQVIIDWYHIEDSSPVLGKSLKEMAIRQKTKISVLAVLKKDTTFFPNPSADYVFSSGDMCVVMGPPEHFKDFLALIRAKA